MTVFACLLLGFLIACAIATCLHKTLLTSIIIFMAYSFMMSLVWILMESPDLGITEAAVGAGISGTLFLVTLKKIRRESDMDPADRKEEKQIREEQTGKTGKTDNRKGRKRRTGR